MNIKNKLFSSHAALRAGLRLGLIAGFGLLAACADGEVRLSGEREDVFASTRNLIVDEAAFAELAGLSAPVVTVNSRILLLLRHMMAAICLLICR